MNNSPNTPSNGGKEEENPPLQDDEPLADSELADSAANGDMDAFSTLLKRYQNSVYALLYNLSQNAETADDLTQQTFIKVWKAISSFEQRSSFATWLYRIVHNVFYDYSRSKKPEMEDIEDPAFRQSAILPESSMLHQENSPDEVLISKERMNVFRQAVMRLSEEHRTALILKEINGLSYKEIAEIMECSTGTVMSRLHYARQNLRTILNDYDY